MLQVMTRKHPRWEEFCERLGGAEGCNFHEDENDKTRWTCKGGKDKTFATAILRAMSNGDEREHFDIPASLIYFEEHGGHCDCEILFNVA